MHFSTPLAILLSTITAVHADSDQEIMFTTPETQQVLNISAPVIFEWTLPESGTYRAFDRMNLTLTADVTNGGEPLSLVSLIAIDIDLWNLSYEWHPSNFTRDLDEISATLLSGNHNRVLAEIGGDPNDESVGFVAHAIEELGLEGYHTMAPAESGASFVGRSMWAVSALSVIMAVAHSMV
ncbi:hypothetical protein HYQ46_008137 [Verticillium longisporum]|nr:hypothetical protein HYQ46_008137 [Verticillium longisporum]